MRRRTLFALTVLLTVPALARAASWDIDPVHSVASFKVRHMMISNVTGEFGKVTGVVNYDPADVTKSTVEATIDAATLTTRVENRDKHLKSPDFFDVEKFPNITFKSKKVEKVADGRLKVTGDLTMKGVTKEVVLDVEGPSAPLNTPQGSKCGAAATTKINRQDFGVSWNKALEGGGVVVGDEVQIEINLEMAQKKEAAGK
jgi:polyisoprenoid-binding protein YceI